MSISQVGVGASQRQRALLDMVAQAEAEETQLLTGRTPARPAATEAMVVEIRSSLTAAAPAPDRTQTSAPARAGVSDRTAEGGRPTPASTPAVAAGDTGDTDATVRAVSTAPPERVVAVLKQTGLSFKEAVAVLEQLRQAPIADKPALRALWDATTATAATTRAPEPRHAPHGPALTDVVVPSETNQQYVAGLTTADYQRLATMLAEEMPDWFAGARPGRGLRGLVERPAVARLFATQLLGTSAIGWIAGGAGMAVAWTAGLRWGIWW